MKISVIRFEKVDWNRLYAGLLHAQRDGMISVFKREEVQELMGAHHVDEVTAVKHLTRWFVAKLAAVNQLTFFYQYRDVEPRIQFTEAKEEGIPMNSKELYQKLESIEYNCIDNAGNDFLPKAVGERLEKIKRQIAQQVVYELQEVER